MHMRTPMHKPTDMQGQMQPRNSPSPYTSPGAPSQENNRQLRDLLQQQPQQNVGNTFRQPLPPGMMARPQRFMGPQHPQVKSVISVQNSPIVNSAADNVAPNVNQPVAQPNMVNTNTGEQQCAPNPPAAEQPQMNDFNLDAKLNPDLENVEDLGDILGVGGDDAFECMLDSFTDDDLPGNFNLLEYADSELDDQANLLDSLDFVESEEKAKRAALEKLNKANENKAAVMGHLRTNLNQNHEQANANQMVGNVPHQNLPNQMQQNRQPPTQQQLMMQQRYVSRYLQPFTIQLHVNQPCKLIFEFRSLQTNAAAKHGRPGPRSDSLEPAAISDQPTAALSKRE